MSSSSARDMKLQKSFINPNLKEKHSEVVRELTVDELDQESTTDLRSSDEENSIISSKLNSICVSDDEKTDLTSESISLSELSSKKSDTIAAIESDSKAGLSPQNENIEFWEEISESTFFHDIANLIKKK